MEKTTEREIKSIGLEFGPNFFTTYLFGDFHGSVFQKKEQQEKHQLMGYSKLANIESATPLYGITHTPHWTLVPSEIFEEAEARKFLEFNTAIEREASVAFDRLPGLGAVLVYQSDNEAEQFTDTHFPGLSLHHAAGVLVELTLRLEKNQKKTSLYLHQLGLIYTVIVYQNGQLMLANRIEAKHLEDIRYFVLYAQKQLGLNPNISLTFLGEAVENTELADAMKSYLPNVPKPSNLFKTASDSIISGTFEARHFLGLNAPLCA